jgi:hypothetical protein
VPAGRTLAERAAEGALKSILTVVDGEAATVVPLLEVVDCSIGVAGSPAVLVDVPVEPPPQPVSPPVSPRMAIPMTMERNMCLLERCS